MERIRATITVTGKVQAVGYRYAVRSIAQEMGLVGEAKNDDDGSVRIIVEGPQETVNTFLARIAIREEPVHVKDVKPDFSKATGAFTTFRIAPNDMPAELVEGFGTGMAYLNVFRTETNGNFKALDAKYGAISQDLRSLVEKLGEKDSAISTGLAGLAKGLSGMNQNVKTIAEQLVKAVARLEKP